MMRLFPSHERPPFLPGEEQIRLDALRRSGLLDSPPEEAFDRVVALAARFLDVPMALLSLVEPHRQFFKSAVGLSEPIASARETPLSHSFCQHVVAAKAPLVVEDAREHPLVQDNLAIRDLNVVAYLGVPLRAPTGEVLGSLCALDVRPRVWKEEDEQTLETLAAVLTSELELRVSVRKLEKEKRAHTATQSFTETAFDTLDDLFFVLDSEGRIVRWNRKALEATGYTGQELAAVSIADFFAEKDLERVAEGLFDVFRLGRARVEADLVTKEGSLIPYEFTGALMRDAEGEPIGVCGIGRNMAVQQAAARDLRTSEARFRSFVEATAQVVWRADGSGAVVELSDAWSRFTGQTPEEVAGWGWADALHPDDVERVSEEWSVHVARQRSYMTDYRVRGHDGTYHWFSVRAVPVFDERGVFVEWVGTCTNIEEQRRAEEGLHASERFLRSTLDALSAHIVVLDAEGIIVSVNEAWQAFARANGGAPDAVGIGVNYLEACERAGAEGAALAEELRAVLAGRSDSFLVEYPCHSPAERRHFVLHASRFAGEGPSRVVVAHENVTEQRLAEEALRVSEERLRLALEAVQIGTWDYDLQKGIVVRSARTRALLGVTDDPYDGPPWQPYALLLEEDRARVGAAMEAAVKDAEAGGRDGLNVEFRLPQADGVVRTLRSTGRVYLDEKGVPARMTGVLLDVSDEKAREAALIEAKEAAETARAEAEAAARLKSSVLANMSHEIRTPLTSVLGFADVLADEVEGEHQDFARMIGRNGRRLLDTLNSVLDFAQIETGRYRLVLAELDLSTSLCDVITLLRLQAETKGLALRYEVPDEPVSVLADAGAFTRIITNLVSNAVKFTDEGSVTVSVHTTPDGMAEVRVADTGVGIAAEFLPRLFEEFRQESEGDGRNFEGNGLGLSISKRLAEMMGGTLTAESTKGVGSTLTVRIPLACGRPSDSAAACDMDGAVHPAVLTLGEGMLRADAVGPFDVQPEK